MQRKAQTMVVSNMQQKMFKFYKRSIFLVDTKYYGQNLGKRPRSWRETLIRFKTRTDCPKVTR